MDNTEMGYDERHDSRNLDQTDVPNCPQGLRRLMLLLPTKFCAMPGNIGKKRPVTLILKNKSEFLDTMWGKRV
jgi:hypothetical protein